MLLDYFLLIRRQNRQYHHFPLILLCNLRRNHHELP
jgi:hypothetical protein